MRAHVSRAELVAALCAGPDHFWPSGRMADSSLRDTLIEGLSEQGEGNRLQPGAYLVFGHRSGDLWGLDVAPPSTTPDAPLTVETARRRFRVSAARGRRVALHSCPASRQIASDRYPRGQCGWTGSRATRDCYQNCEYQCDELQRVHRVHFSFSKRLVTAEGMFT